MTAAVTAQPELIRLIDSATRSRADGRVDAAARTLAHARTAAAAADVDPSLALQLDVLAAQIAFDQQRYGDSLALLDGVVATLSTSDDEVLLAFARTQQAEVLRVAGRYDEALRVLTAALERADARLGPNSLAAAGIHNASGVLLKAMGDYDAALGHYLLALPIYVDEFGECCEEVATLYHNLGGIMFVKGDLEESAHWARRGLELRRRVSGIDHINVVYDEAALAPILMEKGEYDEARTLLDAVLPRLLRDFGANHYEVSVALTNLGALEAMQQHWEPARQHLTRAAEIKRMTLGPNSPELVPTLANLAFVTKAAGALAQARQLTVEAARIARVALPRSHPMRQAVEEMMTLAPATR